jgi:hypothetical protein
MGDRFITLGTIDWVPQHEVLEKEIARVPTHDEVLLALHLEVMRPNANTLYVGFEEIPFAQELERIGAVTYDGEQVLTPRDGERSAPLISVIPWRPKSLWNIADTLRSITNTPVAVIPRPLLNLQDYTRTIESLLPNLMDVKGDMHLTFYYDQQLRESCTQLLQRLAYTIEHPVDKTGKHLLTRAREHLRHYFPSDHTFNALLDHCIEERHYSGARKVIDHYLYPVGESP